MKKPEEQGKRLLKKNRETMCRVMALLFVGVMYFLAVAGLIKPDVKFSEEENRVMAEMPEPGMENLKNKRFMEDLEAYTSDQFFLRDMWIRIKMWADLCIGKREFNGVYLGKQKYLMQIPSAPDMENVQKMSEAMNGFADRNQELNINALIVPDAVCVLKDYLPKGAQVRDQKADMETLKSMLGSHMGVIDVTDVLAEHKEEGVYYKTDHHWTTKGAFYAFEAAAAQMGITEELRTYKAYTLTTDFSGTLSSKSGYHGAKDSIQVYAPEDGDVEYLVSDSDDTGKRTTVYDKSALEKKDKYQVFFGGNHASVDIEIASHTDKRLLIFKDSYANCFVPFLLPYYSKIIMIDPRYYYEQVENLIKNEEITDVLFLYNLDTFLNDNSLADVLNGV